MFRTALRKTLSIALATSACLAISEAKGEDIGAAFLKINPSARLTGMGGAGLAMESGAAALFSNPAQASRLGAPELMVSHSQGLFENAFSAASFAMPLGGDNGPLLPYQKRSRPLVFGVSAVYHSNGSVERRNESGEQTGEFEPFDAYVAASLSKTTAGGFGWGMTVKGIQQRLDDASATGAAVDLGLSSPLFLKGLTGSVSLSNLGTQMKFVTQSYSLPTTAGVGLGYRVRSLLFLADAAIPTAGGKTDIRLGTEFVPVRALALRLGYVANVGSRLQADEGGADSFSRFAGLGGGIGLTLGRYSLDYAIVPHQALDEVQRLSVTVGF